MYSPPPINLTDGYKVDHRRQYPKGTELVYSNWTPRKSRKPGINKVVFFGLQYFIKAYLIDQFNKQFFSKPIEEVVEKYKRRIENYLGKGTITYQHIRDLHALGYLPIEIRALPEGSYVPIRTPMMTICSTIKEFFWVTNFLETLLSNVLWMPCTSATLAKSIREVLNFWADETGGSKEFVPFQGHDFSFRGMPGIEAAMMSGAGHLLSFVGTDTIPAIDFLEEYYNADSDKEIVGVSVPATEHSVMCMHGNANELETFRELITETYPTGIVSIVSDTWNLWNVFDYLIELKDEIMARDGKVVIRPDSSWTNPADIICGLHSHPKLKDLRPIHRTRAIKGVVQNLYEIFGGTQNEKGYIELDPHIGCIYGDAITLTGADEISARLASKGFASTNMVFGIGSFTFQYNTRDTFGFAMKATYGEVNGEPRNIYKDPVTDSGEKKSATGLLRVFKKENGDIGFEDQVSWADVDDSLLEPVYLNGELLRDQSLAEIRSNLNEVQILEKRLVLN